MRTELARVQTEAQKQSFIRNGLDEYEFIVNSGCCPICEGLSGKHFKVEKMMPGENAPPMHPHCRCSVASYSDRKEYDEWLNYLEKGGTTKEFNRMKALKEQKPLTDKSKSGIMTSRALNSRKVSNNARRSAFHILTDDEITLVKADAKALDIPESVLRFNEGNNTSFRDADKLIYIRGDIFPDLDSIELRDRLSVKATLAHEYYEHYKQHPSRFRVNDWRDEFEASYRAALDAPGLNDEERRMLMLDAYDRAKEAGVKVYYNKAARRLIYGQDD